MNMKKIISLILSLFFIGCQSHSRLDENAVPENRAADFVQVIKDIVEAEHLLVIEESAMTREEKLLISTLQGLVSHYSTTQIYIHSGFGGYGQWLEDLEARGVRTEKIDDPWEIVDRLKAYIEGYILCSAKDASTNAANSLVSLYRAPAADESLTDKLDAMGLSMTLDVRGKDDRWVLVHYGDQLSRDILFEQKSALIPALRDYAVATGAFVFFDGNSSFRKKVTRWISSDAPVFGWGDPRKGEHQFVGMSSHRDLYTIPADHARNLSVFSGFDSMDLEQAERMSSPVEENVHYVSFLMSDGDNIQWMLGDLYSDSRWWGSDKRGSFPMGWAVSPMMLHVAPTVLERYYSEASAGEYPDHFVVGPSGNGYLYPSMYSPASLRIHTERLNERMARADLGIVEIIDFKSLNKSEIWDTYTEQKNIDALFYLEYSNHKAHEGKILWSNGKPIITPREMLWEGLKGCDEESVIGNLNNHKKDPSSPDGYSLVLVHAWSNGMDNIKNVIDSLDSDVKVVAPDELVRLINENVTHTR